MLSQHGIPRRSKLFMHPRLGFATSIKSSGEPESECQNQVQGNGFDISNFRVEWDREKVICPAGRESSSWKPMIDGRGNDFIHVAFARSDCSVCVHLSQCTSAKGRRRTVNIKPKELHEALQQNRQREKTKEFKGEYSKRAGVEGTVSQGVREYRRDAAQRGRGFRRNDLCNALRNASIMLMT